MRSVALKVHARIGLAIKLSNTTLETLTLVGIMLATIIATQAFVALLLDTAFQRLWMVRRLVLGRWMVEGLWIEIVRFDGKPHSVGMVHINPYGYAIQISGVNYDLDGSLKNNWSADMVEINWPIIECKHSNQRLSGTLSRLEGYGELQFANTQCRPETYTGFFCHFTEDKRYTVEAIRAHKHDRKLESEPDGIQRLVKSIPALTPCLAPRSKC